MSQESCRHIVSAGTRGARGRGFVPPVPLRCSPAIASASAARGGLELGRNPGRAGIERINSRQALAAHAASVTVTGTLVDCHGVGIPNAKMNVVNRPDQTAACSFGNLVRIVTTDASGRFSDTFDAPITGGAYLCYWAFTTFEPFPVSGAQPSEIACCNGDALGGGATITVSNQDSGTLTMGILQMNYAQNGCPGDGGGEDPRLPH